MSGLSVSDPHPLPTIVYSVSPVYRDQTHVEVITCGVITLTTPHRRTGTLGSVPRECRWREW